MKSLAGMLRQEQKAFVLMHMIDIITVTCSNAALKEWNSEPTKIHTTVFYMQSKTAVWRLPDYVCGTDIKYPLWPMRH